MMFHHQPGICHIVHHKRFVVFSLPLGGENDIPIRSPVAQEKLCPNTIFAPKTMKIYRFWPPKNQVIVIYLLKCRFWGFMVYKATQTSPKFAELPILPYCQAYLALSGRAPGQAVKHAAPTDCQKPKVQS